MINKAFHGKDAEQGMWQGLGGPLTTFLLLLAHFHVNPVTSGMEGKGI